jgi:hypothetical protein
MGGKGHRVIGDVPLTLRRAQVFFSGDCSEGEGGGSSSCVSLR